MGLYNTTCIACLQWYCKGVKNTDKNQMFCCLETRACHSISGHDYLVFFKFFNKPDVLFSSSSVI